MQWLRFLAHPVSVAYSPHHSLAECFRKFDR